MQFPFTATNLLPPWLRVMMVGFLGLGAGLAAEPMRHVKVYAPPGRFGGWPANHGAWIWGNEILVGFGAGYYQDLGERHNIDRNKPEEHLLARSLDGGETWTIENPRTLQRPDGTIVTLYYFHDQPKGDRYIAATLWKPE